MVMGMAEGKQRNRVVSYEDREKRGVERSSVEHSTSLGSPLSSYVSKGGEL